MRRDDIDLEALRDRKIADIANRLYAADVAGLDADDEQGRRWLWLDCEAEAIKQVERIEKRREEESIETRALRWLFDRGVIA